MCGHSEAMGGALNLSKGGALSLPKRGGTLDCVGGALSLSKRRTQETGDS